MERPREPKPPAAVTVVTQNVAALAAVPLAIADTLRSCQDPALSHRTSSRGGVFLLRPWASDHLGTWHEYGFDATSSAKFLCIVLEEVNATSSEALLGLPDVEWHGCAFQLHDVGFSWGAGKEEITAHIRAWGTNTAVSTDDNNAAAGQAQIVVPHAKGLCTLLYVHYPSGVSKIPSAAAATLQTITRTLRPSGTKYGGNVMTEHLVTASNTVRGFFEVSGQTHTAAVGFVIPEIAGLQSSAAVPRVIFGAHLSFKGETHPDHSGQRMRSAQLNLVRARASELLPADSSSSSRLCAIFGDLNIRPTSPFGDCPDANLHPIVQLDRNDLVSETWANTMAWVSSPFNISREPPLHPPTYPICPEMFAAIFRSRAKRKALGSPHGLLEFFAGEAGEGIASGSAAAPGVAQEGGNSAVPRALYDTARKHRFTPASWCDGELSFFAAPSPVSVYKVYHYARASIGSEGWDQLNSWMEERGVDFDECVYTVDVADVHLTATHYAALKAEGIEHGTEKITLSEVCSRLFDGGDSEWLQDGESLGYFEMEFRIGMEPLSEWCQNTEASRELCETELLELLGEIVCGGEMTDSMWIEPEHGDRKSKASQEV